MANHKWLTKLGGKILICIMVERHMSQLICFMAKIFLDQFALQPWHDVSHFFIRIRVVKRWCSCPIMEIKYQMGKLTIFYTIFSA